MTVDADPADVVSISEAATMLGVKPSTVYAYISRNQLTSRRLPHDRRSWLTRSEVEQFVQRKGARGAAATEAADSAEHDTAIAHIVEDQLRYRGRDATELAVTESFESVSELLWRDRDDQGRAWSLDPGLAATIHRLQDTMPPGSMPLDRLKVTAMLLGAADPLRYDLSVPSVISAARRLAPAYIESLPRRVSAEGSIAARLWRGLCAHEPGEEHLGLLSAALVVLADHGLGPSTRAVREAAATAADPYSAVLAGMSVASGLLLGGGSSLAVQSWLADIDSPASVPAMLGQRLRRGDRLSGFGQPRYRRADPRAALLLDLLHRAPGDDCRKAIVRAAVDLVRERRELEPNVEFALGALCFVHEMDYGAGEAIFVTARTTGWIAHAIEVYETNPAAGRL
ncbi:citrate/2-methylcitrate synthase [Amycolatopsis thermophila]|uniref:citrate synthase (unknown stereospecificity) n=1 Tax=Amycolatopsis thermophila TaxID=206084 RepID=A0ABU0F604_9PSEU|nr:citrate/2-methylcitrate synthase [Amycolatopsis thermophila]MDQ0383025.1 citrate synthase [Amycolatopsis thermophila]